MEENNYDTSFQLIMYAGDSKSESMLAIKAARNFQFEEAEEHLELAKKSLGEAHKSQTSMIHQEAAGSKIDVNIILVHAQDHLTTATIIKDQAEEFINIYKFMCKLSKNINGKDS